MAEIKQELHAYFELSQQEYQTTVYIREIIQKLGLDILELSLATGLVAVLHAERPGPVVALHVKPDLPIGTIGVRTNQAMAAKDCIVIEIHGCGGHGSKPPESFNPINAGAQIVTAIEALVI